MPRTDDTTACEWSLPVLTIHEVSQRTGISTDVLRAWERRYGIPLPHRSPAGFRLYSEQDVQQILAMVRYRRSGIAPRQGAFLIKRGRAIDRDDGIERQTVRWRKRFERACLTFDDGAADAVVAEASQCLTLCSVLKDVLFPIVAMLGDGWRDGVIRVSQEHYASQVARRVATTYLTTASMPSHGSSIVAGCAPGEEHELGLLLVACALRAQGFRTTYLGPSVPVESLLVTIDHVGARVAVVAATASKRLNPWRRRLAKLRHRANRGLLFVWAGPGATKGAVRLPGVMATTVDETTAVVAGHLPAMR